MSSDTAGSQDNLRKGFVRSILISVVRLLLHGVSPKCVGYHPEKERPSSKNPEMGDKNLKMLLLAYYFGTAEPSVQNF